MQLRSYSWTVEEKVRLGWQDAALPAVLLALGAGELATLGTEGWVWSIGLETVAALVLVIRRVLPIVATPVSALALMAIPLTGARMDDVATPILFYILGIYSLGRYLAGYSGVVALVLTLMLVFVQLFFLKGGGEGDATDVVFVLSLAVPPYVFGRISRKLALQSEQLARQSEQLRDLAVRDERERIARELHDVVAHSISAMVVQTAAAQDLIRTDPDRAGELLESVAETGRHALAETGRLLHLIRDDADELGLRPAPGLGDVPGLVESFREGGLAVDAALDLPRDPVPGGVDVSAYRVVQEALTNALKYGAGSVCLSVDAAGGRVHISCSNPVGRRQVNGAGLGLRGMAERVGLHGGTSRHGETGDRFEVDVVIPVGRP